MVVFGLTKTDIAPRWRDIAELDRQHLTAHGVELPMVALSAELRALAFERRDRQLNEQSGYPALLEALDRHVLTPAKERAVERARAETQLALDQLGAAMRAELAVLTDPTCGEEIARRAGEATDRLEHLRGPGARWSVVVGDRMTELSNDVSFSFRRALRRSTRSIEDDIELLKSTKDWDELAQRLQTEVADVVADAFQQIDRGASDIEAQLVDLLATDIDSLPRLGVDREPTDLGVLWRAKSLDPQERRSGRALGGALTGLRGAQSGIIMFGMMTRFLPVGVGAFILATPVTLGLGAAFAGFQLVDAHKRKIAQRRQQARINVRQFADDVQFEVNNTIGEVLRDVQRSFRDEVGQQVVELQRTYTETARAALEAAQRDREAAAHRTDELKGQLARVEELSRP